MNGHAYEIAGASALDYGDPVLRTTAADVDMTVLQRLAADANGPVRGQDTRLELVGYFCRQTTISDWCE